MQVSVRESQDPKSSVLRVCHIASGDLWAGAETQVASLLWALNRDPLVEVRAILLNKGVLYQRLMASNVTTEVLDEQVLGSFEITRRLYQFCKDWKPHVVHTHRYKENCLGGLAARCANVPVVVHTAHGINEALSGWKNVKWKMNSFLADQVTKRVASGLIGVSEEISSILRERFPALNVTCIHNGIPSHATAGIGEGELTRERVGVERTAFVVGAVGRLTPVKGIEYLLEAVSQLSNDEDVPSIQVLIVGDGPSRTALGALSRRLGIDERVRFMGERHDVPQLLRLFDVFVMSSLHEGVPMALLEALAAGCPVIASAVGGIPEVVRDGQDGILVTSRDAVSIAKAIRTLYSSSSLRERFRLEGPQRVAAEFTAERMVRRTKQFYLNLVKP